MTIRKIGIIANPQKEKAPEYTTRLRDWILRRGLEVYLEEEIADRLREKNAQDKKTLGATVDLLVVFGGDGTILRTARCIREASVPILGINLGGFGYLTAVNLNEMIVAMETILRGAHRIETRMMLDVAVNEDTDAMREGTVLNDAVINRGNLSRIVELETAVDGRYLGTFKADGLIVSTPTGSTAYSLSAGGPIVFPDLEAIIIAPICPHALTNRPVLLPEKAVVRVVIWTREEGATLTLDGQTAFTLKSGDTITIRRSRHVTKLVASPHRGYVEILRTKLGWGELPAGLARQKNQP